MGKISDLNQRLVLQEEMRTPDTGGGTQVVWIDVITVWASVKPMRGQENIQAGGLKASTNYRITTRKHPAITSARRFKFDALILNIRSVLDLECRQRMLDIIADDGVTR